MWSFWEIFAFIWIGFALVKIVSVIGTIIIFEIEAKNDKDTKALWDIFGSIVIVAVSCLIAWPMFMLGQGGRQYFKFPDNMFLEELHKKVGTKHNKFRQGRDQHKY